LHQSHARDSDALLSGMRCRIWLLRLRSSFKPQGKICTKFPPFNLCPHDDLFYYRQLGRRSITSPIHHWCFLGEIESISGIGRLCLDVKDKEGTTVRIYFYLDRLSPRVLSVCFEPSGITYPEHANVQPELVKEGNTIAVLYAEQHRWLQEQGTGIRIEDGNFVQIFPCGLNELLSLSNQILQRIPESKASESRACDWCKGKPAEGDVKRCSRCRLAWYCSKP